MRTYKDRSGSEHGIYKIAVYLYALQKLSGTYYYREEKNSLLS